MDKISNTGKAIAVAVVVCVAIFLIFIYGGRGQRAAQTNSTTAASSSASASTSNTTAIATAAGTPTSGANPAANGSNGSRSGGSGSKNAQVPVVPPIIIRFITPVVNDVWSIGATNPISWDNAADFTGEIDLLDGSGNFVGVVLSQTGPNQTSYAWDTREYYLARYNPLKKEVVPGTYEIRLKFDGNNLPPITSPVITITN
jgi:hypothetical protein